MAEHGSPLRPNTSGESIFLRCSATHELTSGIGDECYGESLTERHLRAPATSRSKRLLSFDHEYFLRQATLEREAGLRAIEPRTSQMHEDAAQVYDALALKEAASSR